MRRLESSAFCGVSKYVLALSIVRTINSRIEIEGPLAGKGKVNGTFQLDSEEKRPPDKPWSS